MGSESLKEPRAQAWASWKKRSLALVRCASFSKVGDTQLRRRDLQKGESTIACEQGQTLFEKYHIKFDT